MQTQGMRYPVLYFTGVLGATVNQPLALCLRHGIGNLAFQIEVLLATHFQAARQRVRGRL